MKRILAFCALFSAATAVFAASSPASTEEERPFAGYDKTFFMVFVPKPIDGAAALSPQGIASNRFRVKLSKDISPAASLNFAYTLSPRIQDPSYLSNASAFSISGGLPVGPYRVTDLPLTLYGPEGNVAIYQNLDRAYAKLLLGNADLYIGRQVVAWGSAKAVNPTDVIAPFRFDELDAEERVGVDAVRLRYATGQLSEWDIGAVFGNNSLPDRNAFYVRDRLNLYNTDLSLLLLDFRRNLLAGVDLAGAIGGAGVWWESAYVFADLFDVYSQERSYFRSSLGADYTFSDRFYGYLEYHYNGAGTYAPDSYLTHISAPAYSDGAVYLLGTHYFIPGITCQFSPLVAFSGQSLVNLNDGSLYLNTLLEYNFYQNVYLAFGILLGIGSNPKLVTPAAEQLTSEFGSYPNVYFSSLRIYF